jgi:hypothetical protein
MNNSFSFIRKGLWTLIALFIVAGLAFSQALVIGASATFSGTGITNVSGNIVNTARTTAVDITGTVNLTGTSAQSIGTVAKPAVNFETVKATAVSTKTFNVNSTVSTLIDVTSASTTKIDLNGLTLTLQDSIGNSGGVTSPYTFNGTGSKVIYTKGSGNQTVFGTDYHKLFITGASTFSFSDSTRVADSLSHSGGAVLVNKGVRADANYSFSTISNVTRGLYLASTNNGSITTLSGVASGGLIRNLGAARLTIATLSGNSGTIEVTTGGNGKIAFTNAAVNSSGGTIRATAAGDTLRFAGDLSNGGTLNVVHNSFGFIAGNLTNSGTVSLDSTSVWTYDGGNQTVAGGGSGVTYGILRLLKASTDSTKTAEGDFTTSQFDNGGVSNQSVLLDMSTFALNITYPSGTKDNTNSTIKFGGLNNGRIFDTGTIDYNAAGAQNIYGAATSATAYNILLLSGSGVKTVGTNGGNVVATKGNLTINTGVELSVPSGKSAVIGTTAGDLTVNGTLTNNGTVTVGN